MCGRDRRQERGWQVAGSAQETGCFFVIFRRETSSNRRQTNILADKNDFLVFSKYRDKRVNKNNQRLLFDTFIYSDISIGNQYIEQNKAGRRQE